MVRKSWCWIAWAGAWLLAAEAFAVSVQDVVDQVSQASYTQYLTAPNFLYAHNGDDRGFGAQHDLARTNIQSTLAGFGLATNLDPFTYASQTYYNVVAVQPGILYPNQIYIVGAHYDSVNNPGADDNASGVAAVLEAARVLSQYDFESTLIFIAFDREEQGLVGSVAYAAAHAADDIRGMVGLDMIGHASSNPGHARLYDGWGNTLTTVNDLLADLYTYSAVNPADKVTGIWWGDAGNSDHAPFGTFVNGSALLHEHDFSPYYHQPTDSVDTPNYINYAYATKLTRGVVGYLAEAAVLYEAQASVPEPSGLLLLALGLLLTLATRRLA